MPTRLVEVEKSAPLAGAVGIMHVYDPSFYNCSEEEILFMIQVGDAFVKQNHKPAASPRNATFRIAIAVFNEIHVRQLN